MDETSLAERRKQLPAITVLLLNTGLMWFGFFMLIPLVALHATRDLGVSAAMAGLVLAVRQFVQQGLGLFVAAVADWVGYRSMMLCGMAVRVLGFAYLAIAPDGLHLMLAGIVAAIGGAFFDPSGKAALAAVSRGYRRDTIFSLTSTVGNIGMTTGPLVGVALLSFDFKVVGLASAGIYVLSFFLLLIFVPPIPPAAANVGHHKASDIFGQLGLVWQNKPFVLLSMMMAGYFVLYSQINITLPLFTEQLTHSDNNIALIYLVSSGMAIGLQFFAVKLVRKFFSVLTVIAIGCAVAGIGLALIALAHDLAFLIGCVVVYSFGRMIVEPMSQTITVQYASETTMASYFGFSSLALAFGGVIGNLSGGWLFDVGNQTGMTWLCWAVFGIVGLITAAGVLWLRVAEVRRNQRVTLHLSVEATAASPAD